MKEASLFRYQAIGNSGPVAASIAFRQGRSPAVVYNDPELKIPARNPCPTNSLGRVNLYMHAGQNYEVTVHFPDGSTDQFIHTAIPMGTSEMVVKEVPVETVREVIKEVPGPERVVYKDRIEYVQVKPDLEKLEAAARKLREAKRDAAKPDELLTPAVNEVLQEYGLTIHDTYERVNEVLMPPWLRAQQCAELANHPERHGMFEGKSRVDWIKKAERIEPSIKWNRGRMAETI